MSRLNKDEIAVLKDLAKPNLYGAEVSPGRIREKLSVMGLIEWVPPKFGTALFSITDAGREELKLRRIEVV